MSLLMRDAAGPDVAVAHFLTSVNGSTMAGELARSQPHVGSSTTRLRTATTRSSRGPRHFLVDIDEIHD